MKTEKLEIIIREAIPSDAKDILEFSEQTGAETDFLVYGPEGLELSEAFEAMYLEGLIEKENAIMLVATIDNEELIGIASVGSNDKPKTQHVGEVGITVAKDFWGYGLGTALMEEVEIWAKESGIIRRLELTVMQIMSVRLHYTKKWVTNVKVYYPVQCLLMTHSLMAS